MDVETLQAQIDLSNSIAYDLVSSWVKPSPSSAATSISHTISRELEEYAKRPSRLGLGATVSQSSLATSREAARLKGKLVGQKRRRDDNNDHGRAMGAQGPHKNQDEEDEGESRSAAISTKKARVNRSLGKEPEDVKKIHITLKKHSAGDSAVLPLKTTHVSMGTPNSTLPATTSITCPTPPTESRPASSPHQVHSPLPSQSVPLLNLQGPPLVQVEDEIPVLPQEGSSNSKKRKRRRRRKKGGKSHEGKAAV